MMLTSFRILRQPSSPDQTKYPELLTLLTHMTRLTIAEDPGEEFTVRGHNIVIDADDNEIVFYNDVTKVHVLPERENFTIQVLTPRTLWWKWISQMLTKFVKPWVCSKQKRSWKSILRRRTRFASCPRVQNLPEHNHKVISAFISSM